ATVSGPIRPPVTTSGSGTWSSAWAGTMRREAARARVPAPARVDFLRMGFSRREEDDRPWLGRPVPGCAATGFLGPPRPPASAGTARGYAHVSSGGQGDEGGFPRSTLHHPPALSAGSVPGTGSGRPRRGWRRSRP